MTSTTMHRGAGASERAAELPELPKDPRESAKGAGLRYVSDTQPGITRKRAGRGFSYADPDGKVVRDPETLKRIKSLVIPPAWTHVWICAKASGHIQATGRDEKGRKQYRYHPRWREVRDETKYERMIAFGQALPKIRKRVKHDLSLDSLPREKVLATIVSLLESTHIRVGNEEYARENHSFGLTTMRNRHLAVRGAELSFRFRGKSGKLHNISIEDRRLASIVRRIQSLPGQELFQYLDENGDHRAIDSAEVNDYLQEITGEDFTAKDFRTWAGTKLAAKMLQKFEAFDSEAQAKKNIVEAIENVSAHLGNTPSICRKCYVHPAIIDAYMDGTMASVYKQKVEHEWGKELAGLEREEVAVMVLLQQRLSKESS